jgi:hypothetical protein
VYFVPKIYRRLSGTIRTDVVAGTGAGAYVRQARESSFSYRHAALASGSADESARSEFQKVFAQIINLIPGEPWVRLTEMKERFGVDFLF